MAEPAFWFSVSCTLFFCFIHGLHDGGNTIATIVGSRSMRPGRAILAAAVAGLAGPLLIGTAVARTMAYDVVDPAVVSTMSPQAVYVMVSGAVLGAATWKLLLFYLNLPASGSHALVGGLVGAAFMMSGIPAIQHEKILKWVIIPLLVSPIVGLILGYLVFSLIVALFGRAHRGIGNLFVLLQKPVLLFLAATQASNDAQISMGVVTLLIAAHAGAAGSEIAVPLWVMVACAVILVAGLCIGGWRMIRTVGCGICRMEPVHSFGSQLTASAVIFGANLLGGPVSTTQVIASAVMGVGSARRLSAVRWTVVGQMGYAWLLTLPGAALLGGFAVFAMRQYFKL